ncbi:PhzF family phenazine biosynthesis protein [Pelomyxa schiedti]|nr:PhzF family phenazine biosynthesis protein [Pelomyxa schiedti]
MRIYQVDAFTSRLFGGNPAGVVILSADAPPPSDAWMQSVAMEMNLAETAFLCPLPSSSTLGPAEYSIVWFTPCAEVDLCGHATLGSCHVLWETGAVPTGVPISAHTRRRGVLGATRVQMPDGSNWIEMDFPQEPPDTVVPIESDLGVKIRQALGLKTPPIYIGKSRTDFFVHVQTEEEVNGLKPNMGAIRDLPESHRGIIVTSQATSSSGPQQPRDFVCRFFAPAVGIDEDPVTGSAHSTLTPYWARLLGAAIPPGEQRGRAMVSRQASRRGGDLRVCLAEGGRVKILGQAVTALVAEMNTTPY